MLLMQFTKQFHVALVIIFYSYMIIYQMKFILLIAVLFVAALSCPDNCNDCDPESGFCSACAQGFQMSVNGGCVDNNIIAYCSLYGPANQCFSCSATYTIINGACVKDYNACLEYDPSDDTKCINCGFGTLLKNDACIGAINCNSSLSATCTACLNGFTLKNGKCFDNTGNCKNVNSMGVCTLCNSGFKLVGYNCIRSDIGAYGCSIYNSSGYCQLCKIGYNLYQGNCLLPSQIQQIQLGLEKLQTIVSQRSPVSVVTITTTTKTVTTAAAPTMLAGTDDFNGNSFSNFDGGFGGTQAIPNCAQTNTFGICLICDAGYYLNSDQCVQASVFCNTYNSETGACLSCRYDIVLNNSQCNDPNCLNQEITGCKFCKPLFSININGFCTINDPNCIQAVSNTCKKCSQGYYLAPSGTCSQSSTITISNCASQQGSNCNQCLPGYQISNNQCISTTMPANCQTQDPKQPTLCLICNSGFTINNGICSQARFPPTNQAGGAIPISDKSTSIRDPNCVKYNGTVCSLCPNRYYFGPNGLCTPINPQCDTYSFSGGCLSCYSGYKISGVDCIPSIKKLDYNCKSYNALGVCASCYSKFYFSQSQSTCLPLNPLCKTHNTTNGLCLSCFSGFMVNAAGMCARLTSDPYCIQFDTTLNNCIKCASKYFLNSTSKCQQISPDCNIANQTTGVCLSCFEGYALSKGACIINVPSNSDVNCKNITKGSCLECYSGYYINSSGVCVRNKLVCKTIDKSGFCLTCYSGYKLINKVCTEAATSTSSNDVNCKSADPTGNCISCYSGYFLTGMVCQKVDTNCKAYNNQFSACTSCYDGYSLSAGVCVIPPQDIPLNNDYYCIKTQGKICLNCSNGFYLGVDGICYPLNPLCRDSNLRTGACISCYEGYSLSGSTCIITPQVQIAYCEEVVGTICSRCMDRFYLKNGNCVFVSQLCNQYNMTTGLCLNCISQDYFLQDGECIYPSQGKDDYCVYYVNSYCTRCKTGYAVVNYRCAPIDPNCMSFDLYTNNCVACSQGKLPQGPSCIDL